MSKDKEPRIEAPLLKAYLRKSRSWPPHAFYWPKWASWAVFAGLTAVTHHLVFLWLILALAAQGIARNFRKPVTDAERTDEQTFKVIRRMKDHLDSSSQLTKVVPREVVCSLEHAVAIYQAEIVRAQAEDPANALRQTEHLDACMHACFRAIGPVVRADEQGRREWTAMQENRTLINAVVDSIERQTVRMSQGEVPDLERLAALRELEGEDWSMIHSVGRQEHI